MEELRPMGRKLAITAKLYLGALAKRLEHMDIDKYYSIVVFLGKVEKAQTQQDLSREFLKDKAVIVRIIDYLADKNYVQRTVNPADRREHFVQLTEYGLSKLPEIETAIHEVNQLAMSNFSDEQKLGFYQQLCLINENLSSEPPLDIDFTCTK